MRWHLDWARAAFAGLDFQTAETVVLHGDFARWNLLFQNDRLSGVLDFEARHRNYRVVDFALSGGAIRTRSGWLHAGAPTFRARLATAGARFWSWLFLGMKQHIGDILSGKAQPHGFEWQIKHLLKRTGLLAYRAPAYPGT